MATLENWTHWLDSPKILVCPELTLQGGDFDEPLVVGKGEIVATSLDNFSYRMSGTPTDVGQMLRRLTSIRKNPYDFLKLFRLFGKTEDGHSFSAGWTEPSCDPSEGEWIFTGEIESLVFGVDVPKSPTGSSELKIPIPKNYRASLILGRFVRTKLPDGTEIAECTVEAVGTKVLFAFDAAQGVLSVSADHVPGFTPPYAENWLSEPLRMLLDNLSIHDWSRAISPRAMRNYGSGGLPRSSKTPVGRSFGMKALTLSTRKVFGCSIRASLPT